MRRCKPTYWLPIAIAAAFSAVMFFGIVSYVDTRKIGNSDEQIADSYAIRDSAQRLIAAMTDTETGQRGFLLTGDDAFLVPYNDGLQKARKRFDRLHQLATGNSVLLDDVEQLRDAIDEQQQHFAATIELRRQQPSETISDEVLAMVKSGRGRLAMDKARRVVATVVETESERIEQLESTTAYLGSQSQTTITVGHFIALGLIVAAGLAAWLDRKKRDAAEAALVFEQNELAAIIESAFEGIVTYGDDLILHLVNPAAAAILEIDCETAVGRSFLEFVPARLRPVVKQRHLEFIGSRESSFEFSDQLLQRDGGAEFSVAGTAIHSELDANLFTTLRFRDLTEFHTSQAKIREHTAILEQINDAILVCDSGGMVQTVNSAAEQILAKPIGDMIGQSANKLLAVDDEVWQRERKIVADKGMIAVERRWQSPSGRNYILEQRRSLIQDDRNVPMGELLLLIDITDRVRQEANQRRTQRLESIGTLAGGIAHDLNNVLTPIVMSAKLLQRGSQSPERLIENIITSADRGGKMIRKLLAFAGGDSDDRNPIDLRDIIHEVKEMLSHTLQHSVDLRVSISAALSMVDADSTGLSQVLMNLVVNARDAMPGGGRIEIIAENFTIDKARADQSDILESGPHVLITVNDNGQGIEPHLIERIFDPFFTTKEHGKGTGLGLATSLGIVRSHGGDMTVYSEPGSGTKFCIYLPISRRSFQVRESGLNGGVKPGCGQTILVVDDERLILETARETLQSYHYNVVTAEDGIQAAQLYRERAGLVDLVLMDMMMPGQDGFQTKDVIRSINRAALIIATSGLRRPGQDGGKLSDFDGFLAKPYSDDSLLRAVREVLDGKQHQTP